jgi:hypothetical protein
VQSVQGGTDSYSVKLRPYGTWMPLSGQDAMILVEKEDDYLRLSRFDLAMRKSSILVELRGPASWLPTQLWQHYQGLVLDGSRLIVQTLGGGNSRLVDLPTFVGSLGVRDLFAPE